MVSTEACGTTSKQSPIQPWIVIFSASLLFFFVFIQLNMFNAIGPSLFKAFHLTDNYDLGWLAVIYMLANVICLFPAGILLDHYSTRKIILLAMSCCVLSTFFFSFATTLLEAEISRWVVGIAGSFSLLSAVRIASRWFPPKHMALVIGLVVTFAMIGGMIAQTPLTKSIEWFGWQNTLRIDAALGLVMLFFMILFVRDYPSGMQAFFQKQHESLERVGFWHALARVLCNAQNWLAGAYTSLVNLPIFILGTAWGALYLTQTRHLDADSASWVLMMLFFGVIIGSPVLGEISDYIGRRKLPMIIGAIASIVVILAIMYLPNLNVVELLILFFLLGFVISAQVIGYPLVAESNPGSLTGTAEGLASVLIMGGGFAIPLFPFILDLSWNHTMLNDVPLYSPSSFEHAMMIMPIAFLIALICSLLVKETHCQALRESDGNSSVQQ